MERFYNDLRKLGFIVIPPNEEKDYYTICNKENGKYIHLRQYQRELVLKIEPFLNSDYMMDMGSMTDFPDIIARCICSEENCLFEHHQCDAYNINPFEDCIHIKMVNGRSGCGDCKQLWEELVEAKEQKDIFCEKLRESENNLHKILFKFVPEYKKAYEELGELLKECKVADFEFIRMNYMKQLIDMGHNEKCVIRISNNCWQCNGRFDFGVCCNGDRCDRVLNPYYGCVDECKIKKK